jgi:hypothetical protein
MKLKYRTKNNRLEFEIEVPNGKAAFQCVAGIQELFEEEKCGCCQSVNIRCNVREIDNYKYFSLVCSDCEAQLDIGQKKDMKSLFVKRKDKDRNPLANHGWYHWNNTSSPVYDEHNQTNQPVTPAYPSSGPVEVASNDIPF